MNNLDVTLEKARQQVLLNLLDKIFPQNQNPYKIFNRKSFKVTYSGIRNMKKVISSHTRFLKKQQHKFKKHETQNAEILRNI